MKAITLSINPKWGAKVLNGEKEYEGRKTKPHCELPIDVYVYITKGSPYLYYDWNKDIYGTTTLHDLQFGWSRVCSGASRVRAYQPLQEDKVNTNGHVLAKFTLDKVEEITLEEFVIDDFDTTKLEFVTDTMNEKEILKKTCLSLDDLSDYSNGKKVYAWHISNLVIFDEPKELSEFGLKRAPQSWEYIEVEE